VPKIKPPKETLLEIPKPLNINRWLVVGLDPSLSSTGYALMEVGIDPIEWFGEIPRVKSSWLNVGSVRPSQIDDVNLHPRTTVWRRSKATALYLREVIEAAIKTKSFVRPPQGDMHVCSDSCGCDNFGLIIASEAPTPQNDYLTSIQRIMSLVFFQDDLLSRFFSQIKILSINASTLRSLMGLVKRGSGNKKENIEAAYKFIERAIYPTLDVDSCDAILLSKVGQYAACIMLGLPHEVPTNFLVRLCDSTEEAKGKGRNAHTVSRGVLLRPEYWYQYQPLEIAVSIRNASSAKKSLDKCSYKV
jgi:hypothetical protein